MIYKSNSDIHSDTDNQSDESIEINGTCGLQNIGNTCYLNSILQCFSNIPTLKNAILNDRSIIKKILKNEYNYNLAKDYSLTFITIQLNLIIYGKIHIVTLKQNHLLNYLKIKINFFKIQNTKIAKKHYYLLLIPYQVS